jgi:hypothetical protein
MPYSGNPSSSQSDEVRLLLGDTSISPPPNLSDVEIAYFIQKANGVSIVAAYLAAQALVAKFSQKISVSIPRVAQVNYTTLVAQYKELVMTLEAQGGKPGSLNVGSPIDQSSQVPAVIGGQDWANHRTW